MGVVYFIQQGDHGPYKIGYAKSMDGARNRVADLQTGNPEKLHLRAVRSGNRCTEKGYHRILAQWRLHGEWFRNSEFVSRFAVGVIEPTAPWLEISQKAVNGVLYRLASGNQRRVLETAVDAL